jgi:hypothetical protein
MAYVHATHEPIVAANSPRFNRPKRNSHKLNQIPWRRKRDSNPREPFDSNGFQDRRIQPLCHSSVFYLT